MDEQTFVDVDGIGVFYRRWVPKGDVRAIVVIVHGASEHSGRYARFAEVLIGEGYAVYALDLRGHGRTAASTGPGRIGPRGMEGVLDDVGELIARARAEQGECPVVLFGHSLGSLVVHAFVQAHGDDVDAYVLSATMGPTDATPELAAGIRGAVDAGMADEPLDILGGFSSDGAATRTKFDWLSRDPEEVDKYIADPLCGDDLPLTYGFVAAMLESITEAQEAEGIACVPKHLPVLLITGEEDPVSDGAVQVRQVERLLRDARLDVTAKYYPGARHELLNETNRGEVHGDLVAWFDRVTSPT